MKIKFSIVIPIYNGEKTISLVLDRLILFLANYTREIIIIDSGSTDRTMEIINNYRKKYSFFRVKRIKKSDFSHGGTRNLGAKMARGEFVCFISDDAIPEDKKFFKYYLEDFKIDDRVVGVFGKNIAYPDTPLMQKLEYDCRWERVDRYTDKKGVLVQRLDKPFMPFIPDDYLSWYFFSNTSSCFKRSFLVKHPFPKVSYGEDMMIGREIIENGFFKVYDKRPYVLHSHSFTLFEYYLKQKEDFNLRLNQISVPIKGNLLCKIKNLFKADISILKKALCLLEFIPYYLIKLAILAEFLIKKLRK